VRLGGEVLDCDPHGPDGDLEIAAAIGKRDCLTVWNALPTSPSSETPRVRTENEASSRLGRLNRSDSVGRTAKLLMLKRMKSVGFAAARVARRCRRDESAKWLIL
jgi:hypothetical protein